MRLLGLRGVIEGFIGSSLHPKVVCRAMCVSALEQPATPCAQHVTKFLQGDCGDSSAFLSPAEVMDPMSRASWTPIRSIVLQCPERLTHHQQSHRVQPHMT